MQGYDYRFVGDEIFEHVPDWYREKTRAYPQIATDLGRLELISEALEEGYQRVCWLDADVLIFNPAAFVITLTDGFALGREYWVQHTKNCNLKLYRNVHNAYCVFCQDNDFLDFYRYACKSVISRIQTGPDKRLVPQIVGPKMLSSLHNMIGFNLLDGIAMASPAILHDLASPVEHYETKALNMLVQASEAPIYGFNMCASLQAENPPDMAAICQHLLDNHVLVLN